MSGSFDQIYSATYSNVPVFEFVTPEGPIMRRKSDSWINATHILKIARFPKPKRTRILEKEIQTGVHDKVQGGYGKYQGTYVPLDRGAEIATIFGVYDILEPFFKFEYIEGKSLTPPPAPKHTHASASNVGKRQQALLKLKSDSEPLPELGLPLKKRKSISMISDGRSSNSNSGGKKRGRPKRTALTRKETPELTMSKTVPLDLPGPNIGTFSSRRENASHHSSMPMPFFSRQDTEKDALQIMASHMDVKNEDLELAEEEDRLRSHAHRMSTAGDEYGLLTTRELFGASENNLTRGSFERAIGNRKRELQNENVSISRYLEANQSYDPGYLKVSSGLQPASRMHSLNTRLPGSENVGDLSKMYFELLLNYLLQEDHSINSHLSNPEDPAKILPHEILSVPQSLHGPEISEPIDNDGNTIFHWACAMANIPFLKFMLKTFNFVFGPEIRNYNGETPLMFMVGFSNSFQLQNFPEILECLQQSIFSQDNRGRTVLHHIAMTSKQSGPLLTRRHSEQDQLKRKEKYASSYLDTVLTKAFSSSDQEAMASRWLNYQDSDGNTAFHIFAHNLSKRCISILIEYHKFIDFSLRNLVGHTVEDYLASQNYVLKIENGGVSDANAVNLSVPLAALPFEQMQSFETQMQQTKLVMNLQNSMSNVITEKLSELMYAIEKELNEKDEKLLTLFQCLKTLAHSKFCSQRFNLKLLNLDYLVDDIAKELETTSTQKVTSQSDALVLDTSRDKIIQEEIYRLLNDITFQSQVMETDFSKTLSEYRMQREKLSRQKLQEYENDLSEHFQSLQDSKFEMAVELQRQIVKRKTLTEKICMQIAIHPLSQSTDHEFKENQVTSGNEDISSLESSAKEMSICREDSKLYKYCKLVALSCGMSFLEVENSIDLIEDSLSRSNHV